MTGRSQTAMLSDARTAAFRGLVDYAGLFPPASLDLDAAVAGFRRARTGPAAWIAGRFLCPSSRLEGLAEQLTHTMTGDERPWEVGVIFDEDFGVAASHAATFHRYAEPAARVTAAEAKVPHGSDRVAIDRLFTAAASISPDVAPFLEVPITEAWEVEVPYAVESVADVRAEHRRSGGAKLRCGGAGPEMFPTPEQVACFIIACTRRGLPFKATAGLHHPVRHFDEELGAARHGFLNLLLATAVAAEGDGAAFHQIAAIVADTDEAAFAITAPSISYRQHRFVTRAVEAIREGGLTAYGSCDFDEPVADLAAMGALP